MDINETEVMARLEKNTDLFNSMAQKILNGRNAQVNAPKEIRNPFDPSKIGKLLTTNIKFDSQKRIQKQMHFFQQKTQLWQKTSKALMSKNLLKEGKVAPKSKGERFSLKTWQESPVYKHMKESYLLNADMIKSMMVGGELDQETHNLQTQFYSRQFENSFSPLNLILTTPEVCEEVLTRQEQQIINEMQSFLENVREDPIEAFKAHQSDIGVYDLGENLAYTKGKIVFENELIQLIHYEPTKAKHYATPVLITPPFFNKFYVLDLDEKKSLVKGLLDSGYAVFMISWVNPSAEFSEFTFTDYMINGPLVAIEQIKTITEQAQVSLTGFCIGGTLCAMLVAFLRGIGDESVASLTLLNSLLDHSEPGELANIFTEEMWPIIEESAVLNGVFDGRIINSSFSLLRENNLFWSFFIDKYLKGQDPVPNDVLYWNSDTTKIPAACLTQYLHATYWEDKLKVPGGLTIHGIPIDLGKIDIPTYFLSTVADHIVLWKSAYQGTKLLSGPTRFVLGGSGHVAGIINPKKGSKHPHWINNELPETPEQWFDGAEEQKGSWWSDWHKWMKKTSGSKITALIPGTSVSHPSLMDAPGTYVLKRVD